MRLPTLLLLAASAAWAQSPADLEAVVTTDLGTFRFTLAPDKAPKHVDQFLLRARQGYYNGSAFFRVVANGIIQGGDPLLKNPKTARNLWGTGGLNLLADEFSDLKHERGTVSTVRIPGKAGSDGAQFFVCVGPQTALDGLYSAFGRVTEGIDVVEKISQAPAAANGITTKPIRILSIAIEPKKVEPFLTANPAELARTVALKTTLGTLKIALEPTWAPEHVRNFLKLTATGWFNATPFHRIAPGFVVQGGIAAPGRTHTADRWVRNLKGEFNPEHNHTRGIVSMARGDDPNSAATSFFLMLGDAPHLDGQYSVFGRIVEGLEILEAFEKEPVDGETPRRPLQILEATVLP